MQVHVCVFVNVETRDQPQVSDIVHREKCGVWLVGTCVLGVHVEWRVACGHTCVGCAC